MRNEQYAKAEMSSVQCCFKKALARVFGNVEKYILGHAE